MDEAILSSVAGSIIENLGSAAFEQVGSLWNVEDDLEQIRKTVSTIKAVLLDAAEEQNHNHQDRVWLEKLKEAVFDADDLLDESKYYTELALRQKEKSGSFTEKVRYFLSLISVVFGRPKMSLKISQLSQELDAIAKDREKFHWKERSTVKRIVSPKLIAGSDCRLDYLDEKTRHVSFSSYSFFAKTLNLVKASSKLRTILFTHDQYAFDAMDESTLITLIESFPRLRALDLHALNIKIMPNSIGKLIHLKYLDLSFNPIETLPDSITTLLNLQTLKLQECKYLEQLPRDITKLVSLRHLDDRGCFELRLPQGLQKLTGLQSLPLFIVRNNCGLGELNGLNNLKGTLEIIISEQLEDANSNCKVKNLREKQHLEKLKLTLAHKEGHDEMLLDSLQPHPNLKILEVWSYTGVTFSSWLFSIENLVKITLRSCDRCNHLPPFSKLPFLERLWLDAMKDLECLSDRDISEEVSTLSFFPSLKSLYIGNCPNLKGWWRSASMTDHQQHQHNRSLPSFPCLSDFWIVNCPNMTSMPLFPYLEEDLNLSNGLDYLCEEEQGVSVRDQEEARGAFQDWEE
nr:putative disease resistance protein rga4 [Quercus suber]